MGVIIFDGVSIDKETYTVQMAEKIIRQINEIDQEEDEDDFYISDYEHN